MLRMLMVVCVLIGGVSSAAAQTGSVVLLPARGDERLPAQRETAQRALSEALSLQGFSVVKHADALARLPQGASACGAVDCAPNLLRALSMNVAAACAVWLSPDAPEGTVFVTLVDDAGARFPGARTVQAGDIAVATRAALADARGLQMLGPGPWVRVHGAPEGAKVFIDNTLVGTVPYRAAMTAGRYELKVQAPGHVSDVQDLDMPLNDSRVVDVEINLDPGQDPAEAAATSIPANNRRGDLRSPGTSNQPSNAGRTATAGDYILGGTMMFGGVALMSVFPIYAAMRDGDCARVVDQRCAEDYRSTGLSTRSALAALGGAALIAGGAVVMFVWKPFSVSVNAGPQTSVTLQTRF